MKLTITTLMVLTLLGTVLCDDFANFFTDDECNEDGSIGFDIDNPGCFTLLNQGSVYIPNNGNPFSFAHCLVMTYDSRECNCQNDGYDFGASGFCHKLDGKAKSYRFIRGSCDDNDC